LILCSSLAGNGRVKQPLFFQFMIDFVNKENQPTKNKLTFFVDRRRKSDRLLIPPETVGKKQPLVDLLAIKFVSKENRPTKIN